MHERSTEVRATHRNGFRERVPTTQVGDLTLAILNLIHGSFSPNWLEPLCRVDKSRYAVVMDADNGCISTC